MNKKIQYLLIILGILSLNSCGNIINKNPDNVKELVDMMGITNYDPDNSKSSGVTAYSTNSSYTVYYDTTYKELVISRDYSFYYNYIYIYLSEYSTTGSSYYPWTAKASSSNFYGSSTATWDISKYLNDGTLKKGYTYYIYVYPSTYSTSYSYPPSGSTKVGYIKVN